MKTEHPPDWRNPDNYGYLNSLGPNQWAWEFLRRNPEYIKDWESFKDKDKEISICLKWCIDSLRNPYLTYNDKKDDPDGVYFYPQYGTDTILMGMTEDELKHIYAGLPNFKTGSISIEFNILLPINPQIKIAKERLLELQKKVKGRKAFKPRQEEWILLIRILDATAAGVTDTEIANVIFPDEQSNDPYAPLKKVFDKRKQALRYRDHDYQLIPSYLSFSEI